MLAMLKELLQSKKFAVTMTSVIIWLVGRLGFDLSEDILLPVITSLTALVVGIALQDVGKEKARILTEAAASDPPSE